MADPMTQARALLKEHFGYDSFRPAQEELITALLSGRDVLGIMPTGAGKSMCYQIPALLLPGITLVVSPLISLMQDQVRALKAAGIRGAYLNSSLTYKQYLLALENARNGMYKIIYVAPERLETGEFRRFAAEMDISLLAVDEAHCVSQWGHDFRPSYMEIAPFVASLPRRPVTAAFTATATPAVREDILTHLRLGDPLIKVTGFDRENLTFRVLRPTDKKKTLLEFIHQHPGDSGIVYCATRKNVERVAAWLREQGINALGYHAGMREEDRREGKNRFLFDEVQVMVATNAFGMGIDKRNVGYVVHYNMPKNMESYYQEAGRAGRDGAPAECLLLYGDGDVRLQEFLIRASIKDLEPGEAARREAVEKEKLRRMQDYCKTTGCLRHDILSYFGEQSPDRCENCGNCLARKSARTARILTRLRQPGEERSLYDLLRGIRKDYAQRAGLPPELIFSDRTLQAMASERPQNEHDMLEIPGVSPAKYQLYGRPFLRAIQRNNHRRSGL